MPALTPSSTIAVPHHPPPRAERASGGTGARLGGALFAYMLGVTLIITLLPFQFDWPTRWRIMFTGGVVDVVANVLLFIPLGFLYRVARRHAERHSVLRILWLGALASMAIESAQLFEVERYTSVLDVATNALGAWCGALIADHAADRVRVDGALIGRLSLELPLMGLVYLLVPLLWLNALAVGGAVERLVLALLLGVFGASVLGGLQCHNFGANGTLSPRAMALVTSGWFLVGSFPAAARHPTLFLAVTVGVGGLAWWRGRNGYGLASDNRRYEIPVLRGAAPAYAAYLVLLAMAPLLDGTDVWRWGIALPGVAKEWDKVEILRFLELVAACTLLGYMVAEVRGRVIVRFSGAVARLATWGAVVALTFEGVRGWHAGHGASLARGVVVAAATLYGGWLYYLQRAHVVRLIEGGDD